MHQPKPKKEISAANIPLEFASVVNYNENESELKTFIIQTRALIWKNYLVFSRKLQILFFLLLTPVLVAWMINLIDGLGSQLEGLQT